MFIVIPYLASNASIYGIYTVSISVSIFLSYADLGFLNSGQKYAAEYFAQGRVNKEIEVIGFTSFILIIFLLILSFIFIYLAFFPDYIIKNIVGNDARIASLLLTILAIFTPLTLLQRILQIIFSIRLEDYIVQRSYTIANCVKIFSVLYFFREGNYNIVGYFLFGQIASLTASLFTFLIASNKFKYNFKLLFKSIRFNRLIFSKTKNLAFATLFLTITWILYYEMDVVIIGKFLGPKQVALYAIGLTALSFFRSILGVLFSPFNARFNHFTGTKNFEDLKVFYLNIITLTAPFVISSILTIAFFAKPFVLSWVGKDYSNSITIVMLLVLCNLFAYISYPTGILLVAREKLKDIYIVNALMPFIFWFGIILSYPYFGLDSFAIFKLFSFIIAGIMYSVIMIKYLNFNFIQAFYYIFKPLLIIGGYIILIKLCFINFLPDEKSKFNLFVNILFISCVVFTSIIVYFIFSRKFRLQVYDLIKPVINF